MANPEEHFFVRFNLRQRVEHLLIMLLFLLLAVTGFPQKFFDSGWAQWLILHFGGIDRLRWVHRVSGILFTLVAAAHLAVVVLLVVRQRIGVNMVPIKKDFRDAICILRYYLGVSDEYPAFDRYDYRQKFEYWGLVLGGMVMIATGFILYAPILFTHWLPGESTRASEIFAIKVMTHLRVHLDSVPPENDHQDGQASVATAAPARTAQPPLGNLSPSIQ